MINLCALGTKSGLGLPQCLAAWSSMMHLPLRLVQRVDLEVQTIERSIRVLGILPLDQPLLRGLIDATEPGEV